MPAYAATSPADTIPAGGARTPSGTSAFGARRRDARTVHGQPLYLLGPGRVVVPYRRGHGGWYCVVLADGSTPRDVVELTANDAEIETALTVATLNPLRTTDVAARAELWCHRVHHRFPKASARSVGWMLATELRTDGELTVELHERAARRLLVHTHLRAAALHRILARLAKAGFLTRIREPDGGRHWGGFALSLPESGPTGEG